MMRGAVVFLNPGELQASCALHGSWRRPPIDLIIESGAWAGFSNVADDACISFLEWLLSQDPCPGSFRIGSLPGLPWSNSEFDPWDWYEKLMQEFSNWDPPPLLINLDDFTVSQRGEVLWPPPEQRKRKLADKRITPPGALFQVGWFGQGLGKYRQGFGTYDCYGPDELPPLPESLVGDFAWLAAAPEHARSIAPSEASTFAALEQLQESMAVELPAAFVKFFSTPSLWNRIRSCTGCYLDLDVAAVPFRNGQGTLVRFLTDSQGCKRWSLFIPADGQASSVVASYFFSGSDNLDTPYGIPHPKDLTAVADSFEEFFYRFWLENEIGHTLYEEGILSEEAKRYLEFYSPDAN